MPTPASAKRADARTTRWAEHRVKVRAEFVEASIRTIDRIGPQATLDDICAELGVRKPKLYRFFDDKRDLYRAILRHVVEALWDRLSQTVNLSDDSVEQIIRHLVAEYAGTISEHPNLVSFLTTSRYAKVTGDGAYPLQVARASIDRATRTAEDLLDSVVSDHAQFDLMIHSVFGLAASAADWWIRIARDDDSFSNDRFVDQVVRSVVAIIAVNLDDDVHFDATQPLHRAFGDG